MENKNISFSTGNLIISDKNISFHLNGGDINNVNTIGRENIGHFDKQPMRILPKAQFVYCFQMAIIGVIFTIAGLVFIPTMNNPIVFYLGITLIIFAAFLLFATISLDGILGLNVAAPILLAIYGVDALRVVVQNIYGGNNLQFLVRLDEENKIPKFEDYKLEKVYSIENINDSLAIKLNSIEEIEKISSLLDKGILTQEEFALKKKQILGL